MSQARFDLELDTARQRLSALIQRSDKLPPRDRVLIEEALEAFSTTVEELQVAGEELHQQNEELIAAREELAAEQQRYQDLFEFAPDGYLVTDPEGLIRRANHAASELLGVPAHFLEGKPLGLYIQEPERPALARRLARFRAKDRGRRPADAEWEVHVQPRGGPAFPAALTVAPMYDAQEELAGLRWLLRDIRASKRAEERERLLEQIRGDRDSIESLVTILEQERGILQTIMENTHAQLAYLDADFNFVRVNSAYARGSGYAEKALVGRNHFDLFPDGENQAIFEQVRDTGQAVSFQARPFVHPQRADLGTTYWDWTLVPVKNGDGEIKGLVLSLLDVSDRVRAEATLHRRSQEFQALAENAPDIIARFDRSLRHTYVNPAVEQTTGIPCETYIGKTNRELGMPEALCRLWDESLRQVFATGQQSTVEFGYPTPGGTRYFENRLAPEFTPDGTVESVLAVARDITEHRQAQAQLEAERARLRAIIDNAPEAIVVADAECRIVLANPAAEKIYARPVPYGQGFETHADLALCDAEGEPYDPRDLPLTRSALDGVTFENVEMSVCQPGGERRDLLVSTAPIRDSQGQVNGSVGVFQDISARKGVEQALQKRNRELRLLNKLAGELGATLELPQVFERVGEAICEVTGAQANSIWLWDEERPGWLVCRATLTRQGQQPPPTTRLRSGEGIVGWVAQHGEGTIAHDTARDARFAPRSGPFQIESILAVPLLRRGKVIGVLEALNKVTGSFDVNDRLLLETLANPAATAIDNARLYNQAQTMAIEAERSRLARELHDAVSQTLFSASVIAESLPRIWKRNPERVRGGLAQLQRLTRGALAEMRALLLELRPTALVDANLNDLLQQLIDAFASRTRVPISLRIEGQRTYPPEVQIALYRITQEALNNVVKHARASRVVVSLENRPETVRLRIHDDGRGFDPSAVPPERMGLKILRERASAIDADLEIRTEGGQGTEIVVLWQQLHAEENPR